MGDQMTSNSESISEKIARLDAENNYLKCHIGMLGKSLKKYIDAENARLKGGISGSDLDDPDYHDYQQVDNCARIAAYKFEEEG